jgi:hypothetical protein
MLLSVMFTCLMLRANSEKKLNLTSVRHKTTQIIPVYPCTSRPFLVF